MTLKVSIPSQAKSRLRAKAQRLGLTPERYVRQLVEQDLLIDHEARTTTFDELLAPVRDQFSRSGMSESQLDQLVNRARKRHHKRQGRGIHDR